MGVAQGPQPKDHSLKTAVQRPQPKDHGPKTNASCKGLLNGVAVLQSGKACLGWWIPYLSHRVAV